VQFVQGGRRVRLGWASALAACCLLALVFVQSALASTPGKDKFEEAESLELDLPIQVSRTNIGATEEPSGDPNLPFSAGHSVWFSWQAPSTEFVTIGSCVADFHTVVGVFTGTEASSLTQVASGNADEGPHCPSEGREFTFKAVAGTVYKIIVDGNGFSFGTPPPTEGEFTLRIETTPVPANNDFENAAPLSGKVFGEIGGEQIYRASASGYTWGAGKQAGEPDHGGNSGGASVWYEWAPPVSGTARITACCGWAPLLGVYTGSEVNALTPVPVGPGVPVNATFTVEAGTTYRIAVDGGFDSGTGEAETGSFEVATFMSLPPAEASNSNTVSPPPPPRDTKPPQTKIRKRLLRRKATWLFLFRSDERGSTFRCKLDRGRFRRCRSPLRLRHAKPGRHTLRVFAVDAAGNRDRSPAVAHFKVKRQKHRHEDRSSHRHGLARPSHEVRGPRRRR
jgi:hypothetical protein